MSGILVIAEHTRGTLSDLSLELIGAALQVKENAGGPLRVLVVDRGFFDCRALQDGSHLQHSCGFQRFALQHFL